ncbi:MAG TPA: Gfo/Idh/MocA family oxidoreductase [Thermomicrobiales bacterium]|nr:Gfo/Idh/MocA family oxidoreductase [Thermomicrobiales bacterium]
MKRLGVIGYGGRIRHMLGEIDRYDTGATVVAIIDPAEARLREQFPEQLENVTFYDDVDRMLDEAEVDGVLIGTQCVHHTPYAIKVLQRNLPLFLEKPVAINEQQLAELFTASRESSSETVVSFPLRLSHLCQMTREILDSGVIGTIENVQAINNVPFYGSNYYHGWMRNEDLTGGLWLQKATHDLDYLTYLIGKPPARIVAVESKTVFTGEMPAGLYCLECPVNDTCPESQKNLFYMQGILDDMHKAEEWWDGRWQCSFAVDTGNHDAATAILQYESGAHAVYTQNFYARRGAAKRGATFIGYKGTVSFDWVTSEVVVHHHHTPRVERHVLGGGDGGHHGGDRELAHDFLAILNGTGRSRATLEDGLLSAQLCMMAKRSCQTSGFETYHPLRSTATVR